MSSTNSTTCQFNLNHVLPNHSNKEDACLRGLANALQGIVGINNAYWQQDLEAKISLHIDYNADLLSVEEVKNAVEANGQFISLHYKHSQWQLESLHCSSCTTKIEHVLTDLTGVAEVEVNFMSQMLHLVYDPSEISENQIITEIQSLGYGIASNQPRNKLGQKAHTNKHDEDSTHDHKDTDFAFFGMPRAMLLSLFAGISLLAGWGLSKAGWPWSQVLGFYLITYLAGGYDASKHAFFALRKGHFDIDILMVLAALGAASLGEWAEGGLLLFLFSFGHALEHYAMNRARKAITGLAELTPKTARVQKEDGSETNIAVSDLNIGAKVIVRTGERLPADGVVISGTSNVDQSPITGESMPVEKTIGDDVFAGTINGDGLLTIKTNKAPEDSTLARVIKHVQTVQASKAPTEKFTDSFQRWFTPLVLIITVGLIILPPVFGLLAWRESFMRAMTLLVAASPCALALATPSAILAGIARAANSGVLIKGGVYLEQAGMAQVIALDKTGTITKGSPVLSNFFVFDQNWNDECQENNLKNTNKPLSRNLLQYVAAVESRSKHPLAGAILKAAEDKNNLQDISLQDVKVKNVITHRGEGLEASITHPENLQLLIGNETLMLKHQITLEKSVKEKKQQLEIQGKTVVLIAIDSSKEKTTSYQIVGLLGIRDEARTDAKEAIKQLKNLGIQHIAMLTGDNKTVATAIAKDLNIDSIHTELLPTDKVTELQKLQERFGQIIMVGDGVNDTPAMATADIGVAMGGTSSDIALETADIALMADNLLKLPYMIALSRASRRMIVQNLAISLGVIILLVTTSILGTTNMGVAVIFHEGSTLVVVLNALRLLGFQYNPKKTF